MLHELALQIPAIFSKLQLPSLCSEYLPPRRAELLGKEPYLASCRPYLLGNHTNPFSH